MDWNIIIGLLCGLILALLILIAVVRWRQGRGERKGRRGERIVAKELKGLGRREYIVLNDLLLPTAQGRTSQIDHVVVSTRGIFVVETKSLAGRIAGNEHSQYWIQYLSSQSRQIYNPLLQNAAHIRVLRRLLKDLDPELFVSVVVFTEAWRMDIKANEIVIPRSILPDLHIRRTFRPSERRKRRWWCPGREVRLDESRVILSIDEVTEELKRRKRVIPRDSLSEIAERIEGVAITDRHSRVEHKEYAKATSRNITREIRQGNCPRCGGRLVIRKGGKGEFVGCENYPSCRFTCTVDHLH